MSNAPRHEDEFDTESTLDGLQSFFEVLGFLVPLTFGLIVLPYEAYIFETRNNSMQYDEIEDSDEKNGDEIAVAVAADSLTMYARRLSTDESEGPEPPIAVKRPETEYPFSPHEGLAIKLKRSSDDGKRANHHD